LVFAEALVPRTSRQPARTGVFGVEELLKLRDLVPALEERGIRIHAS
jgi:hypothetical protein